MNFIVSLPEDYFLKNKQRPLTALMIQSLQAACDKQHKGIAFGPRDVKRSLVLINRGLIDSHVVTHAGKKRTGWFVTPKAIRMLDDAGVKYHC